MSTFGTKNVHSVVAKIVKFVKEKVLEILLIGKSTAVLGVFKNYLNIVQVLKKYLSRLLKVFYLRNDNVCS